MFNYYVVLNYFIFLFIKKDIEKIFFKGLLRGVGERVKVKWLSKILSVLLNFGFVVSVKRLYRLVFKVFFSFRILIFFIFLNFYRSFLKIKNKIFEKLRGNIVINEE